MKEVPGFNHVFAVERRVYSLAGIRLPGSGVPLSTLVVFVVGVSLCALARRVPGIGEVWSLVPWPLRLVAVPAAGAFSLTRLRIEGRAVLTLLLPLAAYLIKCGGGELLSRGELVRARISSRTRERPEPRRSQVLCGPASLLLLRPYREEPRRGHTRIYVQVHDRPAGRVRLAVPRGRSVELIESR